MIILFNKLKNAVQTKVAKVAGSTLVVTAVSAKSAFAVGTADVGVTTAFTTMSDNLVATLAAVAPYGVAVMVLIFGFKYGKKIFKMIAS